MTYSILAIDGGALGVACATYSLAVGNGVPAIDPAVGAVVSQAWTNRLLRHLVLDRLAAGDAPQEALDRLPEWDEGHRYRQVAVLDRSGATAAWTGPDTSEWAGQRVLPGLVVVGNLLTGPEVLDAMVTSWQQSAGAHGGTGDPQRRGGSDASLPGTAAAVSLARRLHGALAAAERAGGDRRGRQSAALLVAPVAAVRIHPPECTVDLRVDDAADPLAELGRLLQLRIDDLAEAGVGPQTPRTDLGEVSARRG